MDSSVGVDAFNTSTACFDLDHWPLTFSSESIQVISASEAYE